MMRYIQVLFFVAITSSLLEGQTNNPISNHIIPSGVLVELVEDVRVPPSSTSDPKARVNMLRVIPDDSKRKVVIDMEGFLHFYENDEQSLYLDIHDYTSDFISQPGKGTGFGAVCFHPDFKNNGKLYTSHAEKANSKEADFTPIEFVENALQWVVIEWTATDPTANIFEGEHRELFRADFPSVIHGVQDMQFNPTATEDSEDFELLYICIGEGGSSLNFLPQNIQTKESYLGTIFRIDPSGNNSANGMYGIPESNPFADEENSLGEIFAYGFRNPHRISWDLEGEHTMLIGDIGEMNIEEVNIGIKGGNYGWDEREGSFEYKRELGREFVYELPSNNEDEYIYPVAQYDHDEGVAIVGGFVYRGSLVPELYGHYIFGDIPKGRLFHVPVEELLTTTSQAVIKELRLKDEEGNATTLNKLAETGRADLRFGQDEEGEVYFLTKADGKVRVMKSTLASSVNVMDGNEEVTVSPNPGNGIYTLKIKTAQKSLPYEVISASGVKVKTDLLVNGSNLLDLSSYPNGTYFLKTEINGEPTTLTLIKIDK